MKKTAVAGLLAVALTIPLPASAGGFKPPTLPLWLPDICLFNTCVQFTQVTALSQLQNEIMQIQNMTTMNTGNLLQNVAATIARITQTVQSDPTRSGDAAATQVLAGSDEAARKQAAIDQAGLSASGAEQRAQLAAASASIANDQLMQGNAMQAAQIQHQQKTEDAAQMLFDGAFAHSEEGGGFQ